jgi:hypothetical protein
MQPNLVNNRLLMDLQQDNEIIKTGLVKMYNNAGASYNYTYDAINELQSSISNMKNKDGQEMAERVINILTDPNFKVKGNFEVNKQDNIGDFSNDNNLKDPYIIEQQKQTNNRLSEISDSIEPSLFDDAPVLSSLFYDDNTSDVITEQQLNEDPSFIEPQDDIKEDAPPFIEPQEETITESIDVKQPVYNLRSTSNQKAEPTNKKVEPNKKKKSKTNNTITDGTIPPFVAPPKSKDMTAITYNAYVEYLRKKHYGEKIRANQKARWEPMEELFNNPNKNPDKNI